MNFSIRTLVWFWGNLKPSSDERLSPPGRGPYRANPWDPSAVLAMDAIFQAFGSVLGAETQTTLLRSLPGLWVWREDPSPVPSLADVLGRLDALAEEVRQLATRHGQRGHNSGAWFPEEAQREALEVIAETKLAVRANAEDRTPISEDTKSRFKHVVGVIGACLLAASLIVAEPIFDGAMKENGKLLQHLAVAWSTGNSLSEVLANWH